MSPLTTRTTTRHGKKPPALLLVLLTGINAAYCSIPTPQSFLAQASEPGFKEWLVTCRRHLHTIPELYFQEHETSAYIRSQLQELGIEPQAPLAGTGIKAWLGAPSGAGGGAPGVALRSDMDALPITELTGLPYASTHPGRMHACGHDAHMCMLLGAARLLKGAEAQLPGRVALLFQPAEEAMGGAKEMIRDGALEGVDAIFGMHVWPALPAGTVATRAGPIMAASDRFALSVVGLGGHGAMPHMTHDPVVAASALVLALQAVVSRETSPTDGAVITVARFNTGEGASNVIPDSVALQGTVRALRTDTFQRLHARLAQVAEATAAAYGCSVANLTWSEVPYPPTVNDASLASLVVEVAPALTAAGSAGGSSPPAPRVLRLEEPSMAAEDFSFYGQLLPAAFTFLGIGDAAKGTDVGLHNPHFQMDEDQLPLGAALHASLAFEYLARRANDQGGRVQAPVATHADASTQTDAPKHAHEEL